MSDKTVEDELREQLKKFGTAAQYAFQQWRAANPHATKVPRGVWRQMDRLDRDQRWNAKIQMRQQMRAQANQRTDRRTALFQGLEQRIDKHRRDMLLWHDVPAPTFQQHQRRQWELLHERGQIEHFIATSGLLSTQERGQAVRALTSAHRAWVPGTKPVPVRTGPLAGLAALKARAAERLSRIRLGITERGRTGYRPQLDRPATPKTPQQSRDELRHLIAERHEMADTAEVLGRRLRERGTNIRSFAPDAQQMAAGHQRNLAALDREIDNRIIGSGMSFNDWSEVQFQLDVRETPEREANRRWLARRGQWDLEQRYRVGSWDGHTDFVLRDDFRRWGHDFPDIENQQRREFLNPPADWEPAAMDAEDRFLVLVDYENNPDTSHVRAFGSPQSGYDWAQHKMAWIAEPHENVSITVWDRAVPLDANNRVRGYAIDSMQGLYAHLDGQLDSRYDYFRDLSMRQARDRSIPAELSTPGLEQLNQDRLLPWTSVRASNIGDRDQIHSIGESGRVWTMDEAKWFDRVSSRGAIEDKFAAIQRGIVYDLSEEGFGWSEDVEQARFALDHTDALTGEERTRAREILAVTETEARLGQRPDRDLWAAVTDRAEFDRWSGVERPGTPQRPQIPEPPQAPEPSRTDPVAQARAAQAEMRRAAQAMRTPNRGNRGDGRALRRPELNSEDDRPGWVGSWKVPTSGEVKVPIILDPAHRDRMRGDDRAWRDYVEQYVPDSEKRGWLDNRDLILDRQEQMQARVEAAIQDEHSPLVERKMREFIERQDTDDLVQSRTDFAQWFLDGGYEEFEAERRSRGLPERPEFRWPTTPEAPEAPDRDGAFSDGTPIPEAPAEPERPQAPQSPESPDAPEARPEGLDKLERDLAKQRERADRAEHERDTARGQRDEAVDKLIRRTPPEQRYGSPERQAAAQRPEAPEAPKVPEQPERDGLPSDRDESAVFDRSDRSEAELIPDWSGVPEPPEPPEFEPIPARHNGWDGFER